MKRCPKCGNRFTLLEKFKALNRKNSEIKCKKCGEIYRKNNRIISGISIALSSIITLYLAEKIKEVSYSSKFLTFGGGAFIIMAIAYILCYCSIILLSLFVKYKKAE